MSSGYIYFVVFIYMIFLIEPYNAYQKPPKKKHWMELAEEEALYARMAQDAILQEQSRFQEALNQHLMLREASALKQSQNLALISQVPPPSSQQVQDGGEGYPVNAGAGGGLPFNFFMESAEIASFDISPSSGIGPLQIAFTNTTPSPENDTFLWNFGSGSLTSALISPSPLTYTQTGSYTITLQSTSSANTSTQASKGITVSAPTLTALFGISSSSLAGPATLSFSNSSSYNGSGTLTYLLSYGTGSLTTTSSSLAPSVIYRTTGSYTASLQVTESSYNIKSVYTRSFIL